jgi:fructose-1,6-bisphosphatase/inositol monophosphatase family enzyme
MDLYNNEKLVATEAVKNMGRCALQYYDSLSIKNTDSAGVQFKGQNYSNPVARADQQAQFVGEQVIKRSFPEDSILGEENLNHTGTNLERQWLLDPVDGTLAFLSGQSQGWGSMLTFTVDSQPVISAIYLPVLGDLYLAENNRASKNNQPLLLEGASKNLNQASISTFINQERQFRHPKILSLLVASAAIVYNGVSSADSVARFAQGGLQANIVPDQDIWDYAPIQHLLSAAGGAATIYKSFRITAVSQELVEDLSSLIDLSSAE